MAARDAWRDGLRDASRDGAQVILEGGGRGVAVYAAAATGGHWCATPANGGPGTGASSSNGRALFTADVPDRPQPVL